MPKFLTGGSLLTCLSKLELLANCDDDRLSKDRVSVLKSEEEERPFNWHLFFHSYGLILDIFLPL